jgi:hypothetical protein
LKNASKLWPINIYSKICHEEDYSANLELSLKHTFMRDDFIAQPGGSALTLGVAFINRERVCFGVENECVLSLAIHLPSFVL